MNRGDPKKVNRVTKTYTIQYWTTFPFGPYKYIFLRILEREGPLFETTVKFERSVIELVYLDREPANRKHAHAQFNHQKWRNFGNFFVGANFRRDFAPDRNRARFQHAIMAKALLQSAKTHLILSAPPLSPVGGKAQGRGGVASTQNDQSALINASKRVQKRCIFASLLNAFWSVY